VPRDKIIAVLHTRDKYNSVTAMPPVPLRTDISQHISRGIRCGVILFRLYYDAKECTFTGYTRDVGATTLLINLSRGAKRKQKRSNFHDVPLHRFPAFIRREKAQRAHRAKCAFATRILAHLRKSKHFRQFDRFGANSSSRGGPVCAIKGGFNFLAAPR